MQQYLDLCQNILDNGVVKSNRTGINTISLFGVQLRFDLNKGFPAMTTKKLAWKAMSSELLWFIEGSGDERRLCEILHGTRDDSKKTIWTDNVQADYWVDKAKFYGDAGRPYGVQWRHWRKYEHIDTIPSDIFGQSNIITKVSEIDQVARIINTLKNNPDDRRMILTAYNIAEMDQMVLPACHCFCQFYVANNQLSGQVYIRSNDLPLGGPFNIASYALLIHMMAQVSNLGVGELVYTVGDAHIYEDQIDGINEQLKREPYVLPQLWLNPDITNINNFTMNDMKLVNYKCHDTIKMPMAV